MPAGFLAGTETEIADLVSADWDEAIARNATAESFFGAFVTGAEAEISDAAPGEVVEKRATLVVKTANLSGLATALSEGEKLTRSGDGSIWAIHRIPPAEYGSQSIQLRGMDRLRLGRI